MPRPQRKVAAPAARGTGSTSQEIMIHRAKVPGTLIWWRQVRKQAIDEGKSVGELIVAALTEYMAKTSKSS